MKETALKLDSTSFIDGIHKLMFSVDVKVLPPAIFKAANELLHDAIYQLPCAPFDEGHLRASARTEGAGGMMFELSPGAPASFKPITTGSVLTVLCGFNIEYAAKWHEIEPSKAVKINWTLPGSGPKYLESKVFRNKEKYIKVVALALKRFLRG